MPNSIRLQLLRKKVTSSFHLFLVCNDGLVSIAPEQSVEMFLEDQKPQENVQKLNVLCLIERICE